MPPQRVKTFLYLIRIQRNERNIHALQAAAGLKIDVTASFPASGFLLFGEWFHVTSLIVPCLPQV
jgi:hypothetical protein